MASAKRGQDARDAAPDHLPSAQSSANEEDINAFMIQQLTKAAKTPVRRRSSATEASDLEEMNEDLSDFDEDDMIAQLTRKR